MNDQEVIVNLRKIKVSIEGAIEKIRRTHWRESEKAMTISAYMERIRALNLAIEQFELKSKIQQTNA